MQSKGFWKAIANNKYALPIGYTVDDLTTELLEYLDNPDPELRDEIAVETLTHWIIAGDYTPEQLRDLIVKLTTNLTHSLGEQDTYTVLLRSFSALILSIIAYRDWKEPFLSGDEIHDLLNKALYYCAAEKDVRGYEDGIGWLHSAAHTADLLKFLARNPKSDAGDHQRILTAIAQKVTESRSYVFSHSEYDRLAWVVLDVLLRGTLPSEMWESWLDQLKLIKQRDNGKQGSDQHGPYQNTKHFLRAVYFMLAYQEERGPLLEQVQSQVFEATKLFRI